MLQKWFAINVNTCVYIMDNGSRYIQTCQSIFWDDLFPRFLHHKRNQFWLKKNGGIKNFYRK
jgi:hypothetical protein